MLSRNRAPWVVAIIFWGLSLITLNLWQPLSRGVDDLVQVREPECIAGADAYDDYMIDRMHHTDYFTKVPHNTWTVVRYHIDADGTLLDATVLGTSGTPSQAQCAIDSLESLAPFKPLPPGAEEFEVTELFWEQGAPLPPNSLAEELSRVEDGRRIRLTAIER